MLKMDYIQEFVVLAETLNFSKAAELTFVTQPVLSRHVKSLERELNTQLFERNSRNVKLTSSGEYIYDYFKEIVRIYRQSTEQLKVINSGKIGSLRISSPYYWTEDYLEKYIIEFKQKYPLCDVHVHSCQPYEGYVNLLGNDSDIALNTALQSMPSVIVSKIFANEKLCAVCSVTHPMAAQKTINPKQLIGQSIILFGEGTQDGTYYNMCILNLLKKENVIPEVIYYTEQIDTLGMTIQQTDGIGIMPYGIRHMNRSYLRFIPFNDSQFSFPIAFHYRNDNANPAVKLFLSCIL